VIGHERGHEGPDFAKSLCQTRLHAQSLEGDELSRDLAKALAAPLRPAIVDRDGATFDPTSSRRRWANAAARSLSPNGVPRLRPRCATRHSRPGLRTYTLLWATSANAINATLYRNLSFDFIHSFAPVAGVFRVPNVMEVNPSVPVTTVPEFIAYAKANPGKLNVASGGIGSTSHLAAELFKFMTGVDMRHVPYRGSAPALIDLLSGEVQVMFDLMPASIGYIRAGKLRALAVTTSMPSEALPDLPTVNKFLPGFEASTWNGVSVPANTERGIIDKLNRDINAGLADANIKARLIELGAVSLTFSPTEFGKLIVEETEKWSKVIRAANIKPE
jgi:tripartite-type tricarboxylate transporter receptor subunit TctC